MTAEEAKQALGLLRGHWPSPSMEVDEQRVWAGCMAGWGADEFVRALEAVVRADPRRFRPTPSEVGFVVSQGRRSDAMRSRVSALGVGAGLVSAEVSAARLGRILNHERNT